MRLRRPALLLASLAVVAAAATTAAEAEPVDTLPDVVGGTPRLISPGVEVFDVVRTEPVLRGRVARIAPDVVRERLRVVVSNDEIAESEGARRESTTSMCLRYRCVVGVNADQWYVFGADASSPVGGTVVDGELWRSPEPDPNEFTSMGQLQFDVNGFPDARQAPAGWSAVLVGEDSGEPPSEDPEPDPDADPDADPDSDPEPDPDEEEDDGTIDVVVNRIPLEGEVALYTHRLGDRTPVDAGVTEWTVSVGPLGQGDTTLTATSGEILGGGTPLSENTAVLAARGEPVADVAALLSAPVTVRVDLLDAYWAVGGFPVLMEDSEYAIFPDDPANARRDARTVAGWDANGQLLLVTVDERPDWSAGASITEAAELLRTLGAIEAINLDGGGSSTFVEGGRVANRPSDGTDAPIPRAVVDALVIIPPEGLDFGTAVARVPSAACPPEVPPAPFDDLGGDFTHRASIACVAAKAITLGTGPRAYAPMAEVSRAQMAAFLERLLAVGQAGIPGDPPDAFTDDNTSQHQLSINRLAAMGIVGGVGGGRYDPNGSVSRAQMATFLARTVAAIRGAPIAPATQDFFVDDSTDTHEANINIVATLGIATGVGRDTYAPSNRVSRAQMASFLVRALDAGITGTP
jgi:hypothetical protein